MRLYAVLSLTILAIVCIILQHTRPKGTLAHYIRGFTVGGASLLVVFINTYFISAQRGLTWDAGFIAHNILGGIFFISWIITVSLGMGMGGSRSARSLHGLFAYITTIFFFLSLVAAGAIRFIR